MFEIDYSSRTPIYEQIYNRILRMISDGELAEGEKLPSIRTLASELGINFNTVKRVFAMLEDEGFIYTVVGSGSFVKRAVGRNDEVADKRLSELSELIKLARASGVRLEEITSMAKKIYEGDAENDKD